MQKAATQQQPMTIPGFLKDLVWQGTGIPELHNAWREAGYGMNTAQEGDNRDAARYGLSAVGDAGLAALALRYGVAPQALKLIGRGRIGGVIRNDLAAKGMGRYFAKRQLTELPTVAKWINRWGGAHQLGPTYISKDAPMQSFVSPKPPVTLPGTVPTASADRGYLTPANRLARRAAMGVDENSKTMFGNPRTPMRRLLDIRGRYDPNRYAFDNPDALFHTNNARSLPGHIINAGRYLANRGVNAAYAGKQLIKRHPLATGSVAFPALAAGGVAQDDQQRQDELAQNRPWYPDSSANAPSGQWMPASTMASNLLGSFGGGSPMSPLQKQFS